MIYAFLIILNLIIYLRNDLVSKIFNIYDKPDNIRKFQKTPIPVSGGLILFINLLLILIYLLISNQTSSLLYINTNELFLNLSFILTFWLVGILDDKFELKAVNKIILMILVISIYIFFSDYSYVKILYFENGISFNLKYIYFYFTIFCIFTLTLTLNMYDGIDGQSLILYIFLNIYLYTFHQIEFCLYFILPLIFILILNLQQKIYIGDNGVMLFSSILSILLIKYNFLNPKSIFVEEIFLILIIPALDLIRLFFQRMYRKKNPLIADSYHIHHLINRFVTKKNYIFFSIVFYSTLWLGIFIGVKFVYLIFSILLFYSVIIFKGLKHSKN